MDDKWRINKVGDDWMFIPKKERDEKRDYENLTIKINQREKKIESDLGKIKELKKELRKMKSYRTNGYNNVVKYHKKFLPTFSIFLDDDKEGKFNLSVQAAPPIILAITSIGYNSQDIEINDANIMGLEIILEEAVEIGQEIVVSASRIEERILESPVSI